MKKNIFYAQSGGVTSVINATAEAVILEARKQNKINRVYCGHYGIIGALDEDLVDVTRVSVSLIKKISNNPGGVFGSCRFKLGTPEKNKMIFRRLLDVFDTHDIGYFLYNGGGDSADTTHKIMQAAKLLNYPLAVGHIPKTIDNDLPITDCSPGFASVAKYIAVSTQETSLDLASMHKSSTKVFIFEVMGRHAGWIAASAGMAKTDLLNLPLIILFPEIPFNQEMFCEKVAIMVKQHGYVSVVVSEGLRNHDGKLVGAQYGKDAFGHDQLGGVGNFISSVIFKNLKLKCHTAIADYLQRSARHIASKVDLAHARALGKEAVRLVVGGKSGRMPIIKRESQKPYRWRVASTTLAQVANKEKTLPRSFISSDGYGITTRARNYLEPLLQGEAYTTFKKGVGNYQTFNFPQVGKKLLRRNGYRIILLGPPGAGKGTQADLLCASLQVMKVSCGDLLRIEARSGSELGRQLSEYMVQGKLVPDSLIITIMQSELAQEKYSRGYLLDGFPRTVGQAQAIERSALNLDGVFEITVPSSLIVKRITGRWVHAPSGRTYHTEFNPPKKENIDDVTGEKLTQRSDDKPETVENRLAVYQKETKPLTEFYKKLAQESSDMVYHSIDGSKKIKVVQKLLESTIKRLLP